MALILIIESSAHNCSVALARDGDVLAARDLLTESYSHAEKLHLFISEVLKESGCNTGELQAVFISAGPGSYTGLRIGVSAAKGLCFALSIPLMASSTLEVLALEMKRRHPDASFYIPMIDARRMEVYTATFDVNLHIVEPIRAEILGASFFEALRGKVCQIGGDGAMKASVWKCPGQEFSEIIPFASFAAEIAERKFSQKDFEDVAGFEPLYLKDFIPGNQTHLGTLPGPL